MHAQHTQCSSRKALSSYMCTCTWTMYWHCPSTPSFLGWLGTYIVFLQVVQDTVLLHLRVVLWASTHMYMYMMVLCWVQYGWGFNIHSRRSQIVLKHHRSFHSYQLNRSLEHHKPFTPIHTLYHIGVQLLSLAAVIVCLVLHDIVEA